MQNELPLISCLCVTKNRPVLLNPAIQCFMAQSYQHKELIIVFENTDEATIQVMNNYSENSQIKSVAIQTNNNQIKLGELRNIAIKNASGEYCCQWDDDDWYHSKRLAIQFNQMQQSGMDACILEQWLIFDGETKQAYLSHKRHWEGSLLCKKEIMLLRQYANIEKGEDTALVTWLKVNRKITLVVNQPHLFIYNYHGSNTWSYNHFKGFFNYCRLLSDEDSLLIKSVLENSRGIAQSSLLLNKLNTSLYHG
jgi:glycosyltransferase involved in cell wall biosynthesis